MADREWYEIDGEEFPNLEAANAVASDLAEVSTSEVLILRFTQTAVRRYTRQVTVVAEDITPT